MKQRDKISTQDHVSEYYEEQGNVLKVLLVNPPNERLITANVPDYYVSGSSTCLPPLGLLNIATYLDQNTVHSVDIFDSLVYRASYEQIAAKSLDYDLVGITTITFYLMDVIETVKAIRRVNQSIPIVLGGPHVAIYPAETVQIPGVNFCMTGECDQTFTLLVNKIAEERGDYGNIPGLYWIEEGKVQSNPGDDFIQDLNTLPIPDRNLLEYKHYNSILSHKSLGRNYVTTAFSSRGCPYKCIFCDRPHLGKKFRAMSAARVVEEIKECLELNIREVMFYDDTFTIHKKRVYEICELIFEQGIEIKWDIRARVDTVDYPMLKLLKRAGCCRIHFGVEAANPEMMKILKKGITQMQVTEAFKNARKAGIETLGYFMFGCPGETRSQMQETLDFALGLNPDYAHFAILTPFPGTPLYHEALKQGWFDEDYWQAYAKSPDPEFMPKYLPNTLPREELIEIQKKANKAFYLRPRYLLRQTLRVRSWKDFIRKFTIAVRIFLH